MFDLEANLQAWSDRLRSRGKMQEADVQELESHLRDEIDDLTAAGLAPDEAFIISIRRMGNVSAVSQEYAKLNMGSFWKQLLKEQPDAHQDGSKRLILAALFSLLAGTAAKLPDFCGWQASELYYLENASLFVFPLLALYFILTQKRSVRQAAPVFAVFALSALLVNLFPFADDGSTSLLTGIHLPLFLWLTVGAAYLGGEWRSAKGRMDFIRFSGELFIYAVLLLCGGLVLTAFLYLMFHAIGIDLTYFCMNVLPVYGICTVILMAAYLVEFKKSVIENFAPVLAKIFSPVFLLVLLAFLAVMLVTGRRLDADRDILIGFDLVLALVLGLVVFLISSRDSKAAPGAFDLISLLLIAAALVSNGIALSAIVQRLASFGFSPNKLAALGENILLMVNLGGLAVDYLRFFRKKTDFSALERWQTAYLWVYGGWFAVVAFLFPVLFQYV